MMPSVMATDSTLWLSMKSRTSWTTAESARTSPLTTFQFRTSSGSAVSDGTIPTATLVAWLRLGP